MKKLHKYFAKIGITFTLILMAIVMVTLHEVAERIYFLISSMFIGVYITGKLVKISAEIDKESE